ncbi:MAG: hypothetical protein ABL933_11550 [Methyloglobulus sp.]|nr:hypothetical protein [Methyloglobulus sp.]
MKAIVMTATGNPDVLHYQDIDEPQITNPAQIKVKLAAAGVNPVDTKIRRNGLFYDQPLPVSLKKLSNQVIETYGIDRVNRVAGYIPELQLATLFF